MMQTRIREGTESSMQSASSRDGLETRSTKDLMKELVQEGQHLIREEVHLAKAELQDEAKRLGKGAGAWGAAGVVAHIALGCFAAFLILALAGGMKAWVAAMLVTVLFAAVAAGLFVWGKQQMKNLKPNQTLRNLEEDRRWMKDTLQRVKSPNPGTA